MTVKELAEALFECDPSSEVLDSSEESITEVVEVISRRGEEEMSHVRLF